MIAVVGAGSWGTALGRLAALRGERTLLVCRTAAQAAAMAERRAAVGYLDGVGLPPDLELGHLGDVDDLRAADLIVIAVPAHALTDAAAWLAPRAGDGARLLSATKGLEPASGDRPSEVLRAALPSAGVCALSGPNHAEEVAADQPTATVVAGDAVMGREVQATLNGPRFRVYLNPDLIGVELCAAAKNVIAVAAGISDGVGAGDNAKASLITRGLAEMTRLGSANGARDATFRGLAGMGDLVATCTSGHSRNRRAGELLARGLPAAQVEERMGQVAEGLWTVRSLLALAARSGVELPISQQVAAAAYEGRPVTECMEALMGRAPAAE